MKRYLYIISILLATNNVFATYVYDGWYAGLMGTASVGSSLRFLINNPLTGGILTNGRLSYELGGGGGGQIGYRYCKFRVEGELLYTQSNYSKLQLGNYLTLKRHFTNFITPFGVVPFRQSGFTGVGTAMINVLYELYNEDYDNYIVPYIGLGAGYARIQNNFNLYGNSVTYAIFPTIYGNSTANSYLIYKTKNNTSAPLGQVIVGLNYVATEDFTIGLDFRYLATQSQPFVKNSIIDAPKSSFQISTINLNFNYSFDPGWF